MNQFKRAQVIILPKDRELYKSLSTPKPIGKVIFEDTLFPGIRYTEMSTYWGSIYHKRILLYHLYIISDDEIKEGDWYLNSLNSLTIHQYFKGDKLPNYGIKKIISTTDSSISNYSVKTNPNSGISTYIKELSQPSQQFIEKFIESYNKGEVITDVLVEYESKFESKEYVDDQDAYGYDKFKQILRINPKDNTITIKKLKDSWNKEEIVELLHKLNNDTYKYLGCDNLRKINLTKWIEENL